MPTIRELVGEGAYHEILERFRGQRIYIRKTSAPRGRALRARNDRIRSQHDENLARGVPPLRSARRIAAAEGLALRTIWRILNAVPSNQKKRNR